MSVRNVSGCIKVKGTSVYGVVNAHAINVLWMVKVYPCVGDADVSGTTGLETATHWSPMRPKIEYW